MIFKVAIIYVKRCYGTSKFGNFSNSIQTIQSIFAGTVIIVEVNLFSYNYFSKKLNSKCVNSKCTQVLKVSLHKIHKEASYRAYSLSQGKPNHLHTNKTKFYSGTYSSASLQGVNRKNSRERLPWPEQ